MIVALPWPAFAEAAFACATATQLVAASTIPAWPAFFRMLRPVRAQRWKRLLVHAWFAGAELGHTRQGCRHPCVSAASRLARPFCTRPPDFSGAYSWGVLLPVVLLFRSTPFHHLQSSGDASMVSAAGAQTRGQTRRPDSSGDNDFSYATDVSILSRSFSYVGPQHFRRCIAPGHRGCFPSRLLCRLRLSLEGCVRAWRAIICFCCLFSDLSFPLLLLPGVLQTFLY